MPADRTLCVFRQLRAGRGRNRRRRRRPGQLGGREAILRRRPEWQAPLGRRRCRRLRRVARHLEQRRTRSLSCAAPVLICLLFFATQRHALTYIRHQHLAVHAHISCVFDADASVLRHVIGRVRAAAGGWLSRVVHRSRRGRPFRPPAPTSVDHLTVSTPMPSLPDSTNPSLPGIVLVHCAVPCRAVQPRRQELHTQVWGHPQVSPDDSVVFAAGENGTVAVSRLQQCRRHR